MSFWGTTEEEHIYEEKSPLGFILFKYISLIFLAIFFLPAILVGMVYFWGLFGKGKQRWTVNLAVFVILNLLFIPITHIIQPMESIKEAITFNGLFSVSIDWLGFIIPYLYLCVLLGVLGGFLSISFKVFQFKVDPSLLFMEGWTYQFSYKFTPYEKLMRKKVKKSLEEGAYYDSEVAPLGILQAPVRYQTKTKDNELELLKKTPIEVIGRPYPNAMEHTIISGSTGSGKSVSMLTLAKNDILFGNSAFFLDFKKSPEILFHLSRWAKENDREFLYFSNGDDNDFNKYYGTKATYDPFSSGDASARTDVIMALREWDNAASVYKDRMESLVTSIQFALLNVNREDVDSVPWDKGGLHQFIAACDTTVMFDLIQALNKKYQTESPNETDYQRLKKFTSMYNELIGKGSSGKALREQLDGVSLSCNKLVMSSYGQWLTKGSSDKHIDLVSIATSEEAPVVLFSISALEEMAFAKSIGSIIMSDIKRAMNFKNQMGNKKRFGIYIDEYQTLNPKDLTDLLEKVRSAQAFCTIANQSVNQIATSYEGGDGEKMIQSILDTCGNYLVHAGAGQDTAERFSKILGDVNSIKRQASTNKRNRFLSFNYFRSKNQDVRTSSELEYILPTSELQNLSKPDKENNYTSEAYFISSIPLPGKPKGADKGAHRIQVVAQKDIVEGVPQEFLDYVESQSRIRYKKQTGIDFGVSHQNENRELDDLFTTKELTPNRESYNSDSDEWEIEENSSLSDSNDTLGDLPLPNKTALREPLRASGGGLPNLSSTRKVSDSPKPIPQVKKEKPSPIQDMNKPKKLTSYERMQLESKKAKEVKKTEVEKPKEVKKPVGLPKLD